jgi:hypothetical protein
MRSGELTVGTQHQQPCCCGTSISAVASCFNRADTNRLKASAFRTRYVGFDVEWTILSTFRKFRLIRSEILRGLCHHKNEATITLADPSNFKCIIRNKDQLAKIYGTELT